MSVHPVTSYFIGCLCIALSPLHIKRITPVKALEDINQWIFHCHNCLYKLCDLHPSVQCIKFISFRDLIDWFNGSKICKKIPTTNKYMYYTKPHRQHTLTFAEFVSRMMFSREGYSNDVSPCTSLLRLRLAWLPYDNNILVSDISCSTSPCCKSLFLWAPQFFRIFQLKHL